MLLGRSGIRLHVQSVECIKESMRAYHDLPLVHL